MIFRAIFLSVCTTVLVAPASAQEPAAPFVVKDVHFAPPPRGDTGFRWHSMGSILDLNGDGLPEFGRIGAYQNYMPSGQADAVFQLSQGGTGRLLWTIIYDQFESFFSYPAAQRGTALLNGQHGIVAVRVSEDETHLGIFPAPIGSFVKWIPIPEVVPGALDNRVVNVSCAGDVNLDGTDDFLYEGIGADPNNNTFRVMGIFDGLRMEPLWLVVQNPGRELSALMSPGEGYPRFEDLNGDGFFDIIIRWTPVEGLLDQEIRALSGKDGALLWQHFFPRPLYTYYGIVQMWPVGDLDQDGVSDFLGYAMSDPFQGEPGYLRAVSASTGQLLWEKTAEDFDPYYSLNPPDGSRLDEFREWIDYTGDGISEFTSSRTFVPNSPFYSEFWIMDGATSRILQTLELGFDTLAPWSTATVPAKTGIFMGIDLDEDGWPEGYVDVNVDPGVAYLGAHQATVGVESLRISRRVKTGVPIRCKIHIPSSPGKDFRLLFSKSFKPGAAAHHIGGWNTTLQQDATTRRMNGVPGTTGTLDNHGWYSSTFMLPAGAGLEGSTVYVRGLILDPSKPSGIKTLTTLSTLTVQ
jgi:hypothetical protein